MKHSEHYKIITSNSKDNGTTFKELWHYKDLIFLFVKRDFTSLYKQTILGPAWAIVQPLLTTVIFTFIFGNVAGLANCEKVPTFLFYMCANIAWQYFSGCLIGTSNTFIGNASILGKVYFPRIIMPISTAVSNLISYGIQSLMFLFFILLYSFVPTYDIRINCIAFLSPLLILQMLILSLACGIIVAALTTKYRDLQMLVSFGVSLWMYATPVAYPISIFNKHPILLFVIRLNPMTSIIEMLRYGFLGPSAGTVNWGYYYLSWCITLLLLLIGIKLFHRVEKNFMDTI